MEQIQVAKCFAEAARFEHAFAQAAAGQGDGNLRLAPVVAQDLHFFHALFARFLLVLRAAGLRLSHSSSRRSSACRFLAGRKLIVAVGGFFQVTAVIPRITHQLPPVQIYNPIHHPVQK